MNRGLYLVAFAIASTLGLSPLLQAQTTQGRPAVAAAAPVAGTVEQAPVPADGTAAELAPAAPPKTWLHAYWPGLYMSLELRHNVLRQMERDEGGFHASQPRLLDSERVKTDNTRLLVRPTIGSKFFDGRVDTSFTYVHAYRIGTFKPAKADLFNSTKWAIVAGTFNADSPYSFGPSLFVNFFNGADRPLAFSYADLGVTGEAVYKFPIPTGSLALRTYLNPNVEFYSVEKRNNKAKLLRDNASPGERIAALREPQPVAAPPPAVGPATTPQNHATYLTYYAIWVTYKPAANDKFGLTLGADAAQVWKPVYQEVVATDGSTTAAFDHYTTDAVVWTRLTFSYAYSEHITVANQTRHYHGGFYQRTIDGGRLDATNQIGPYSWENRLSLTLSL